LNRTRSATVVWTLAGEYDATACSCVVWSWMSMLQTTFVAQAAPTPVVVAPTRSYPVSVRVFTPPISAAPEHTAGSPPTVVAWSLYRDEPQRAYRIATVAPVQSPVPEGSGAVIVAGDDAGPEIRLVWRGP